MDRRSWLWRRKPSDKSPGETESSGSVSSEMHSGEQEVLRTSINSSPNHGQSPEVSSKDVSHEDNETIKLLNEKLSAALLNVSAKEDLVKQHGKIAEEAVLGWENAEKEISSLKQHLEAASRENLSLEDRVVHLDAALKECVRQLRQTREEQEQKVHDAITKNTHEWESEKLELEIQLTELQAKMEAKAETTTSFDYRLRTKIEILEEENSALKVELDTLIGNLQMRTVELELSTRTAEAASKQHLDSIKKVARLEAECRRLRAAARKLSLANEHKVISSSHYVESVTDSQSDAGEQLLSLENEQSCSDSWASALITELDQFKMEKSSMKCLATSVEIDLMDDFLEMERLVALPEADHGNSSTEHDDDLDHASTRDSYSRTQLDAVHLHMAELQERVEKMTTVKVEMEMSLAVTNNQLKDTCDQLVAAEGKLVELQRQLNLVNGEKHVLETELETAEGKKNDLEIQLESANIENAKLHERINILDRKFAEEELSAILKVRCENIEVTESNRKEIELQLELAYGEVAEFKGRISLLEGKLEEEKALSTELASRCWKMEVLKGIKEELECELESANSAIHELQEKVNSLEMKLEEGETFSVELLARSQSMEAINAKKKELESQLTGKQLEVGKLQGKVNILEGKVDEERKLSSELVANIEAVEAKRKELVVQLELAHVEVGILQEKLIILEKQVEEERALSADFARKYHKLEHELTSKQQAAELHRPASSSRVLKARQEKNIALAAGKFAECQKTIASLNQRLKSLANFDDLMLETEPGSNADLLGGIRADSRILDPSKENSFP
ncbi:hypothetical protein MUK42_05098 [Musa troglodytarum]|uniref:Filament-like plant protein 3 n=1 Tax=Musa troglodytarum TaxID=320322 RepID=A0A9E7ERC0_9LILI|nr:hypothetical protein MUK42_05098 [Musa troglodytarum]